MKKVLLSLLSCLVCCWYATPLTAQKIQISGNLSGIKHDSVQKQIMDYPKFVVYYDYAHQVRSGDATQTEKGHTLLQIGEAYNRFTDLYSLRYDSIADKLAKEKSPVTNEYFNIVMSELRKRTFLKNILIDKQKNLVTVQEFFISYQTQQYEEEVPPLAWELLEGDTIIADIPCKKATLPFRGRNYTAWYAPSIELPYGPYLFNGLPGLILFLQDDKKDFSFLVAGLEAKDSGSIPIYLKLKKVNKTSREECRKLYKSYCDNPGQFMRIQLKEILAQQGLTPKDPPSKPYNPMELE